MTDFFEHLNQIPTTLGPIEKEYWEKQHKWAYDQIASKITDDHIIDLGCGCGLLGIYLVYINKVKTATLYDGREPQITYAQDLVTYLGLQDKIKIYKKFVKPGDIIDSTIVTSRFGSLLEFEKFSLTNRLITLRRTKEVEPYFVRPMQLPWTIEIVKRDDGFELELLTIDLHGTGMQMLSSERWMEELNPELMQFSNYIMDRLTIKETHTIGNDSMFVTYNKTA